MSPTREPSHWRMSMQSRSGSIESVRLFCRLGGGRYKQKKCNMLCCNVIDACNNSNDV